VALPLSPRLAESLGALRSRPRAWTLPGPAVRRPASPFDGGLVLRAALESLGWAEPVVARVVSRLGRGPGGLLLGFARVASAAGNAAAALWSALIGLIITHHAGDGADRE